MDGTYGLNAYLDEQENLVTQHHIALIQNALTELTGEDTPDDGFNFASVVRSKYDAIWTGIDCNVTKDDALEFKVSARYNHTYNPNIAGDTEFNYVTGCGLDVLEGDAEDCMLGLSETITVPWEDVELKYPAEIAAQLKASADVLYEGAKAIADSLRYDDLGEVNDDRTDDVIPEFDETMLRYDDE